MIIMMTSWCNMLLLLLLPIFALISKEVSVFPFLPFFSLLRKRKPKILNPISRKYSKTDYDLYREQ